MAAPTLRLRRGSGAPGITTAAIAEPFFDTGGNLYVATASNAFAHIGGSTYTSRVDEFLTAAATTTSGEVTILSRTDGSGGGSVTFDVADTGNTSTYTWPDAPSENRVLQSDSNGDLSWVTQTAGYSGWTILADDAGTENIANGVTVDFTGGTGINTTYNDTSNELGIAIDNTVVTLTGTQTLTNKTLTSPVISTISNTGTLTLPTTTGTVALTSDIPTDNASLTNGAGYITASSTDTLTNKTLTSPVLTTPQINDTSADHQYVFAVSELTADRTVTLPLLTANDTFVFEAHAQTLTNKTISGADNTLTNIANASLTNSSITIGTDAISLGGSRTDLNGLTSLDVDNITIDGNTVTTGAGNLTLDSATGETTVADNLTVSGNLNVQGTTTTVNTTSVLIEDPLQELGLTDSGGSLVAPTAATSGDRGLKLHYHDGSAAFEAYMIFDASTQRMVFAVDGTDSSNTVSVADPDFATIHAKGLYVTHQNDAGDTAVGNVVTIAALGEDETEAEGLFTAGNGVAGVYLLNTTIDCGSY